MKLIIEIPEEDYIRIKETGVIGKVDVLKRAIRNGTILPKGHGRLIDADAVLVEPYGDTRKDIGIAETIIEADKEVKNEQ